MKSKQLQIIAAASLILGILVSIWSYYFITYSYGGYSGTEPLPPNCTEYDDRVECIGLTDYETNGFPFQFSTSDWSYEFENNKYDENTVITIDYKFSWPLFVANVLVWSAPIFLSALLAAKLLQKRSK